MPVSHRMVTTPAEGRKIQSLAFSWNHDPSWMASITSERRGAICKISPEWESIWASQPLVPRIFMIPSSGRTSSRSISVHFLVSNSGIDLAMVSTLSKGTEAPMALPLCDGGCIQLNCFFTCKKSPDNNTIRNGSAMRIAPQRCSFRESFRKSKFNIREMDPPSENN